MNEDLGKNILLDTILEYEKYSNDTKLPKIFDISINIKRVCSEYKKEVERLNNLIENNSIKIQNLNKEVAKINIDTEEWYYKSKQFKQTLDVLNKNIENNLHSYEHYLDKLKNNKKEINNKINDYKKKLKSSCNIISFLLGETEQSKVKQEISRLEKEKEEIEKKERELIKNNKQKINAQIKEKDLITSKYNIYLYQHKAIIKDYNNTKNDIAKSNMEITKNNARINKAINTKIEKIKQFEDYINSNQDLYKFLENSLNNYFDKNDKEVVAYCNLILKHSPYNANDGQSWLNLYNPETKNLIIDYNFPPVEIVSNIKEVRYLKTRDEYKDVYYSKTEFNKLYDNMLYQITLLTIYELFISDRANAIDSICFNGWLKSKNKATGHDVNNCILTIQVGKTELLELDLKYVDPKECFKKLKGIANSKLHSVIPVAPIISINREDERFIEPKNIQENIDESYNLAVMDWEDFEHLIREVFEKEFAKTGGEVKVTRSSRDKGVDAIAFDPDPIKGGKIVIQAKRYTNTVGVSAVRDLYGTILNEGANKGILVTTSDYGPDAFEFAKGKPITLLNGGNLLNLLAQNGQKARIDIKEAKQLRLEKEKSLFTEDLF